MSKKTRGPNFSANEKDILVYLVNKYKYIVENKKTDAVTTAMKSEAWKKLTEEFNSTSSFCVRNVEQLKTCWDNIKRTTEKAATKKQIFLTGGGRPGIPPPGPLQRQVEILLGPTLEGLNNPYDSDVQFLSQGSTSNIETIEVTETVKNTIVHDPGQQQSEAVFENIPLQKEEKCNWKSWTPAALKSKVASTLSTNR